MTAPEQSRFLSMVLANPNLLGVGVLVIEMGSLPQVVRWPNVSSPKRYFMLYRLDSMNRHWLASLWRHNLEFQLAMIGGAVADITFAAPLGEEYACFLCDSNLSLRDGWARLNTLTNATRETQMSLNLQYLQLQCQMQHENRTYSTVSNIMKTKHDTVMNSIRNVR